MSGLLEEHIEFKAMFKKGHLTRTVQMKVQTHHIGEQHGNIC